MKTQPLLVPVEDLTRPLAARRHPYRAAPACQVGEERAAAEAAEAREAISDRLSRDRGVVVAVCHKAGRRRGFDMPTVDEMVSSTLVHLSQYSLPRFDATRGVKISTFLHHCSSMHANQLVKSELRRRARSREFFLGDDRRTDVLAGQAAADTSLDRRVERIAKFVLEHPEKYLTDVQVKVFQALVAADPGTQLKDLAKKLGYERASSLTIMKRRIFDRIAEISIEDFEDDAPPVGLPSQKPSPQPGRSRPMIQLAASRGAIIREWPGAAEAAAALGISAQRIRQAAREQHRAGGFYWAFADTPEAEIGRAA